MPLINTSLPNLIQGVSQQADSTRFAGQCDEQENALSAVVGGLKKRPNTRHIKRLIQSAISTNSFIHFINRSADEKYVVILDGTTLRAFNLDTGAQCTINGLNSYTTTNGYLNSSGSGFNPRKHIKALTVADNTFLLNTQKTVLQNTTNKTDPVTDNAIITVKQGDYSKTYRVDAKRKISGGTVSVAITPDGVNYRHTFTITNRRYAYHVDGSERGTRDYEQVFKIYPKGFSPNHPAALRAEISITSSDYSALETSDIQGEQDSHGVINANRQVTNAFPSGRILNITTLDGTPLTGGTLGGTNQGYILLSEEFPEWVVEPPIATTPMGTFNIVSGGDNAANNADTEQIARNLVKPLPSLFHYNVTPTSNSPQTRSETITVNTAPAGTAHNYNRAFSTEENEDEKYVDFSVIEARDAFYHNFTFKLEGSNIIISDFPKEGDSFESYYGFAGAITKYQPTMGDGDTVEFTVEDGLAGNGLSVTHKQTDSITSLPKRCVNGFKIKVIGDAEQNEDDFYVKFITNSGNPFGDGAWVETSGSNINQQIDSTTFLHRLINTAPDTFSLKSVDPTGRNAGDDISNPFPSFVYDGVNGNASEFRISNLFFFKNRLGLLNNENVIMSEAGQPFNFFRTTTMALLDSAPIDVAVSSSRVTTLKSAVGFQENLILFSEGGQFVLKSSGLLTPQTVSISPITNFNFEAEVAPLPLGSYIYFPFNRGSFSGLREFVVNSSSETYDAIEVTEHVPAYIPNNIIDMAGTTSEDTIALLSNSSGEQSTLYIYNFFWNNRQKVLSSWSKFTFDDTIRGIEFIESTLYMVTTDVHSNTHLLSLPFKPNLRDIDYNGNTASFNTLLDKRVRARITNGSNLVQFNFQGTSYSGSNAAAPYTFYEGSIPSGGQSISAVFVDETGTTHPLRVINSQSAGVRVFLASGTASGTLNGYVGYPYDMKYKFSTQIFKDSSGQSASPSASSAMTIRNGAVFFDDTRSFDVKITAEGQNSVTNSFSAGTADDYDGFYRFPVHSQAKNVAIEINNSSPFDSKFNAAEFESFVHPRSKRYG